VALRLGLGLEKRAVPMMASHWVNGRFARRGHRRRGVLVLTTAGLAGAGFAGRRIVGHSSDPPDHHIPYET